MIPREIDSGFDPAPAFGFDDLSFGGELFADKALEQGNVLQVSAVILVEQIADDDASSGLVGIGADEERAAVACMHGFLGEHAADGVGSLVPLLLDGSEDLLLTVVVVGEAKRHELIEGDFVTFVSLKEQGACLGETEALFHHMRADIEGGGDCFFALPFVAKSRESPELIERMQRLAFGVLGETVGFDKAFRAHDAGDGRVFCELLLFDEKLQRAEAAAAGLYAVGAGFFAGSVQNWADAQGLKKAAPFNVGGKAFDRDAGLDLADIAFMQDELVEGNGLRRGKREFWGGFGHRRLLGLGFRGQPRDSLSRPPLHSSPFKPLPLALGERPQLTNEARKSTVGPY